ncbi:hypothetical protein O6H91_01G043200 [Diphasiastrum complanatum]|uniref:Uncharacterized protein n=1 Tax=Diphasiastrum complanatum TaxID=34168 RepID=A0ACC2EQ99_DIPCM|nr:hypothetical protein O6H91_01G043200 [Diphasiastrum complanatum]
MKCADTFRSERFEHKQIKGITPCMGLGRNGPLRIHPVERLGVDTITRRARKVLTKDGLKGSSNADQTIVSFPTEQHLIQCPAPGAIQQLLQDQFVPYINPAEALGHIQRRNIGHKAHAPRWTPIPGALAKYWVIVVLWQNIASQRIDWMWAWRPRERLAKKPILGLLAMSAPSSLETNPFPQAGRLIPLHITCLYIPQVYTG